jgi:SAM-dependent methyltransferase
VAEDWAGDKGRFWAEQADWFSQMLSEFLPPVIAGAALRPGERVLDVGSGGGDLSIAAATAVGPEGSVVGVDLSADEIAVALGRVAAVGLENVSFELGDAGAVQLSPPFDVLVSRFGVMFFEDPVAAFTHLHGALRPGGRVAFACWQVVDRNAWMQLPRDAIGSVLSLPELPAGPTGPYAFAEPDHVRGVLTRAGFADIRVDELQQTVHLGRSVDEALQFVATTEWAKTAFADASDPDRKAALAAASAVLEERAGPGGEIDLPGAAWLVQART